MFCETFDELDALPVAFTPAEYRVKWATLPWEFKEAYALRRAVFCVEQGIFVGDDRDEIDNDAKLLVALSCIAGVPEQVVGTVRIHETQPRRWLGSRLAVHAAFRSHGKLGSTLIRLAVSSAHALGCDTFLAHVQSQNAPLFRRLHWQTVAEETLFGRPHHLMEADLEHYPPCFTPESGFVTSSRGRS
ncbi:MSMEG_0567/Sll0786 family nitrogen starvation N-acetyltransferase [Paraburkholderia sp. C35]|uniref:MSMEG_0567/Sll0786 family nitrogen starvation N-acetyltransferase n=1 Tax=Paraburkholderia sp. C35 TaxID=2126993 RepID=UPI000D690AA7|nr:MSMEG_0567/Sll0786 family nitrogen starvation N-acetyltransferase [Paraburkholderia sp. C35]